MTKGHTAYHLRAQGQSWPEIAATLKYEGYRCIDRAINIAKRYAQHNNQLWPPPLTEEATAIPEQDHDCGAHLLTDENKATCGVCHAKYEWSDAEQAWMEL